MDTFKNLPFYNILIINYYKRYIYIKYIYKYVNLINIIINNERFKANNNNKYEVWILIINKYYQYII